MVRDVENARNDTVRATAAGVLPLHRQCLLLSASPINETPAAAAAAQANSSPEPPTKERELQTQLSIKESEIRRLNDRLVTMCEQAADNGRLQCELQQERNRVMEFQSDLQELQRQLMLQKDEANAQILQVMSFLNLT